MSVSKTSFFQGIVSLLTEMSKTFTGLSKKVDKLEESHEKKKSQLEDLELKMETIIKQHIEMINQIRHVTMLQSDIAKQIVNQHEETENLYKALGLKKDLSYYSFNLHKHEGH